MGNVCRKLHIMNGWAPEYGSRYAVMSSLKLDLRALSLRSERTCPPTARAEEQMECRPADGFLFTSALTRAIAHVCDPWVCLDQMADGPNERCQTAVHKGHWQNAPKREHSREDGAKDGEAIAGMAASEKPTSLGVANELVPKGASNEAPLDRRGVHARGCEDARMRGCERCSQACCGYFGDRSGASQGHSIDLSLVGT